MGKAAEAGEVNLYELQFPRDAEAIIGLPPVEEAELPAGDADALAKLVGGFRGLLIRLTRTEDWSKGERSEYAHGGRRTFWILLNKVASYYTFAIYRFAELTSPRMAGELVMSTPFPFEEGGDQTVTEDTHLELIWAWIVLIQNDSCIFGQFTSALYDFSGFKPGELPADHDPDLGVLESFESLHRIVEKATEEHQKTATDLLRLAFAYRASVLRKRNDARQKEIRESLEGLSPRELRSLATRSEMAIRKYGRKRVERIFEQRLALLFQALGFTVVQARPGAEAADLLCISRADHFSFLVDAKSSKGNYVLPRADQRALRDYASGFSQALPDLPPLAMALVVGGDAAGTVPGKIEKLQDEMNLPVRFVPVKVLSDLRGVVPGPVPATLFRDSIKSAPPVVDDSLTRRARDAVTGVAAAYERFIGDIQTALTG